MPTDRELIISGNQLAEQFLAQMGYVMGEPGEPYDFHLSEHPRAVMAWEMACTAYEHITHTDLENASAEVQNTDAEAVKYGPRVMVAADLTPPPAAVNSGRDE